MERQAEVLGTGDNRGVLESRLNVKEFHPVAEL